MLLDLQDASMEQGEINLTIAGVKRNCTMLQSLKTPNDPTNWNDFVDNKSLKSGRILRRIKKESKKNLK